MVSSNNYQGFIRVLLVKSKGSLNRTRILCSLEKKPMNSNALAKKLCLDYKTIQHHLALLLENQLIVATGVKYGQVFFLSPEMKDNWGLFKKLFEEKNLVEEEK